MQRRSSGDYCEVGYGEYYRYTCSRAGLHGLPLCLARCAAGGADVQSGYLCETPAKGTLILVVEVQAVSVLVRISISIEP